MGKASYILTAQATIELILTLTAQVPLHLLQEAQVLKLRCSRQLVLLRQTMGWVLIVAHCGQAFRVTMLDNSLNGMAAQQK